MGAVDTHGTAKRSDDTVAALQLARADAVRPGASSRTSSRRAARIVSAEAADSYLARTYPERHVAGAGVNAYIQLSGTSMAAGVVSGAVALLLEAKPSLTPRATKAVLQLTSTFLPSAGSGRRGRGHVNALAAVELVETNRSPETTIGGEDVSASGIYTVSTSGEVDRCR